MRQPTRDRSWRDGRMRKAPELRDPEGGEGGGGGGGGRGGEVEEEMEEGERLRKWRSRKYLYYQVFILS